MKNRVCFVVLLSLIFSKNIWAQAQNETNEKTQKQIIESSIEAKQKKIIAALIKLNLRQKKMVFKLDKLLKEKELLELLQEQNIKEIKKLSQNLIENRKTLSQRVKTIGKFKGENLFKTMLMFPKLSQIEKNLKIMSIITANDLSVIQEYFNDRMTLKEKIRISKLRIDEISKLEEKITKSRAQSESEYKIKSAFLEKLKKEKVVNDLAKNINDEAEKNLEDTGVLDFISSKSFTNEKGKLPMPLKGIVLEHFGYREDEDLPTVKNNGIFISSPDNQVVLSVYDGKLVETGEIKGLGKYALIDHGDNYYSLYGNLKSLFIRSGSTVKKGDKIAFISNQYLDNQSGLYFELRHYSKALNPEKWIGGWNESQKFN